MEIEVNELLTRIEDLELDKYPDEILELFWEFINNVPYILALISPSRKRAKNIERKDGKIVVDITLPHILEDVDYFRLPAITFTKTGKYTNLRPNPNPNSEYGKWIREEVRRCYEGYVRESDGEWITGDMYYFLNYCPMQLIEREGKSNTGKRIVGFPRFWEGHYYLFHYLLLARQSGKHAFLLASRARGKSFLGAGLLAKRFLLGESYDVNKKVVCYITASDKKYLQAGDLTLDKFIFDIDHCALHTLFPSKRLINSVNKLEWVSGYKDLDTDTNRGTLNAVIGISSANDEAKLRGTRGVLYILEEIGTFPKLLDLYGNMRHSVELGGITYGTIFGYGTSGDNLSDFSSALEIMYNPEGYNVYCVDNVYDKEGQSRKKFVYFFPGFMNYEGYYDNNGNSDVTGALLEILKDRYRVKYNSSNVNAITKRIAESPIVPLEAILRTTGNIFPVTQLNERLALLDSDPNIYDDIYIGDLAFNKDRQVIYIPTNESPIRDFPLKDNTSRGAIEIYLMPLVDSNGKIPLNRYIGGFDPYDNDLAESSSLGSFFILDLFTDRIVLEYTGRTIYADELYEKFRLALLFYNAKGLYESNIKGCFSYFSRMNSTHLLADTPEYLRDKLLIKYSGFGSNAKGVRASNAINNYANSLIKEWLIKPVPTIVKEEGEDKEIVVSNLYFLKNRALLKELILYNPDINVDRIRALGMIMLYREEFMIRYLGDLSHSKNQGLNSSYLGNDDFFSRNYTENFSGFE